MQQLHCFVAEECDYIIAKATPRLHRSQVVSSEKSDNKNGTVEELSDIRTSAGMFFARGEDEIVKGGYATPGLC